MEIKMENMTRHRNSTLMIRIERKSGRRRQKSDGLARKDNPRSTLNQSLAGNISAFKRRMLL